ncbi:peroxidase-like [Cydia splendana]|uniref:peroxidase-like n=1 Tax=Cydia splendana TaxID=1100963 RepID=UPI00300C3229
MLKYGLISEHVQYVTAYDESAVPLVYAEFEIAVRYFHTMLDGRIKLYDEKYHYDREFSVSNTTFRQSLIEQDKNFEKINRGTFYQHAARIDDIQDPEISEKYYGDLQRAADLPTLDIQRGRDLGIRGYNDYRHICGMKPARKFEDFEDVMDHEKIEALRRLYVQIEDIDLLAGLMSENHLPDTYVGPTLFCIMTKQLQLYRYADRFWFERGHQFHSFTLPQLHEVRKTNIARFACDNADAIKFIQPHAFELVGPHNEHVPCTHIPGLDIKKWKDNSCYNDKHPTPTNEENKQGVYNGNNLFNNKEENQMEWAVKNKGSNIENKNIQPLPKLVKIGGGVAWPMIENTKNDGKNEQVLQWSMNLNNENNNERQNTIKEHKETLHRTPFDNTGQQKEEMTLLVSKPGPNSDHWTINKYGKFEGAVYGPTKKHHESEFLALKYSLDDSDEDNHHNNNHKMQDDGKFINNQNAFNYLTLKHSTNDNNRNYGEKTIDKGENNRHTLAKNVHVDNNEWINRNQLPLTPHNLNGQIFASTGHQMYQSNSADISPLLPSFI